MGFVFGYQGSGSFYVAQWKYSLPQDFTPNPAGFYGAALGSTGADGAGQVFYAQGGLDVKQFVVNHSSQVS